ncbi:MAG: hypothetical protein PHS42_10750 [Sulfurimonas sp.]|nr:hypothetical protein [Sulfurimonas sp.]MDD3835927.1 hypothetical protein [Sulfurimonas sp.]
MTELDKKFIKIAIESAREAQKNSLENGIANVYSKNNQIFFQLPDGTITQRVPKEYQSTADTIKGLK